MRSGRGTTLTLFVHRAERSDRLVDALGELLAQPLADPFALEVVAVPAKGIERWLTQQLARRLGRRDGRADGICAGVRFPSPTRLFTELLDVGDRDPWAPDSLVWPLLDVIDAAAGEPWCEVLSTHLGVGAAEAELVHRRGRRYSVARRLAGLFSDYAAQRPQILTDWAAGRDTDGFGGSLAPDLSWQPEMWRRTRDRIAGPDPLARMAAALGDGTPDLPERVSLFGPTRLPAAHLDLVDALAERRDVHLWLPHPSPELWRRIAAVHVPAVIRRDADPTILTPEHPLLSSLGRDARELQLALGGRPSVDLHHPGAELPATLLGRLQADLRDDRRPAERLPLGADDRTVQVHACHGPSRQIDVLREVLVGLLADDPTLEPRDILVMCPDIEVYAPLVAAAFGLADVVEQGHPAHQLRVRLADRALVQTNPLLATVARLLELADARITASQLLDLAAWPPVRRRFGFSDDDLETITRWTADSGVRWGLDAAHRQPFGLSQFPQGTWKAGLDRILLGATMADEGGNWLGLALPVDDVGSGDVDLAGRLAELINRLHRAVDLLTGPKPVTGWLATLASAVAGLTSVSTDDAWQQGELDREFADIAAGAGPDPTAPLRLPDVRALLAGRLGGRPTRANFRTGNLTVCTMVPMRSVPHRVVALVGLDDGVFPRAAHPDGDDVLARDPVVGERDRRGEDRQLLLDAMLAATGTVVITYTGADERTGAVRPPSVPIGELLDTLDDMAVTATGEPARSQVLVRHPLQPFDLRNVVPGRLGVPGPFSFDPAVLASARAAAGPREAAPAFLAQPLFDLPPTDLDLGRLIAMLHNPARGFLRQRLDVAVRFEDDEPSDALPVELDALQQWAIGERLLRDRLSGQDPDTTRQAEWRRGTLPPGPLGQRILGTVMADVDPLVNATAGLRVGDRTSADVLVPLGTRRLVGTVAGLYDTTVVAISYSRLGAKARLQAWIQLLALSATHPAVEWTAVTVGRGPGAPEQSTLGPVPAEQAREVLEQLVDLYDRALGAPLPLPLKTGLAYAESRFRRRSPEDALNAARMRWVSDKFPGEDADPAFVRIWGAAAPFADVNREPSRPDERWMREPSRFTELALRLWFPLLTAERRETL
ncbi:exodeoxyribonuclease V subunit gamma [Nakamurella deserti]|uniref:exodeoxyribonuclease V subunit gamma n=1 Tax=Nakamurella deserti TaxID=2164074 RepID=UPI001F0C54C0|nr:exodeoxyribonuclease V subunit gamma [Nakamurella deserti]